MGFLGPKQPYFGLRGGWLTFWITVACGTDMTLFGYDQGVFGGVIVTRDFLERHDLVGDDKTATLGTVVAIYDVGCFLGAILAAWLGEKIGRKRTVLLGTIIMSIGALLQITSYSLGQMFVGRVVAGIGNGLNTATAPVWQTETSQIKWRGKLIVIELILNIAGFSLSNWVTYGFSFLGGGVAWRVPLALQFIFIAILFGTVPWLPESPRWLIAHEYEDEAFTILADLENKSEDDPFIITQHKEIVYTVQYERANAVPWSQLLRGKTGEKGGTKTIRRLLLGMGTQFIQQMSGINVTSYYLPTVLIQSVGLSETMARLLAACNSVSYLLFSLIGIPNVERWGRRKMLMFAAAGQCFCYTCITALLRYSEQPGYGAQTEVASASIAFFFLYYVFFGIGMQEINSLSMRTKGAAAGTATNWIFNFLVVEITPYGYVSHPSPGQRNTPHPPNKKCPKLTAPSPLGDLNGIQSLHWKFYIIWTIFNGAFVPMVYFLYPETAGRSLEDIDDYYRGNPPLLVWRDHEAKRSGRPEKYRQKELDEVRRNSSADPAVLRRGSRVSARQMEREGQDLEGKTEVGEGEVVVLGHKEDA